MVCELHITNLCLHANHGVMEQERRVGADFWVSLDAQINVDEDAYIRDQIEGTVSYADVINVIKAEMALPSNLLEHVAYRMAKVLLERFSAIQSVTLRIDKQNPPCGVASDSIGISTTLHRQ